METYFPNIEQTHSGLARERVLADLRKLVHDAENLLKATAHDVREPAQAARVRLAEALQRAKATCSEFQPETFRAIKTAAGKTDAVIREHPYQAIGVAFGAGLIIGVLVARR